LSFTTKRIKGVEYEYFEYSFNGKRWSLCLGKKGEKYDNTHVKTILRIVKEKLNKVSERVPFERLESGVACIKCKDKQDLVTVVWEDEHGKKVDNLCLVCLFKDLYNHHGQNHIGFLFLGEWLKIHESEIYRHPQLSDL